MKTDTFPLQFMFLTLARLVPGGCDTLLAVEVFCFIVMQMTPLPPGAVNCTHNQEKGMVDFFVCVQNTCIEILQLTICLCS